MSGENVDGKFPDPNKQSYIVPIPKLRDIRMKTLTCDEFRVIEPSSV